MIKMQTFVCINFYRPVDTNFVYSGQENLRHC